MVDSDDFPLDPNITTDCFWNAVTEIEKNYSSASVSTPNTISSRAIASTASHPLSISSITNNSHTTKTPIRPRTNSSSSATSSASSTSSNSSGKKRKFKCPKPVNNNTTYYKQYTQKYKAHKSISPPNTNTITSKPIFVPSKTNKTRARNPLNLSQTQRNHNHHHHNNNNNNKHNHSFHALHTNTVKSSKSPKESNNTNNALNLSTASYKSEASCASYRANNIFSASCTAESISRMNLDESVIGSDGFTIPKYSASKPKTPIVKTQETLTTQHDWNNNHEMKARFIKAKKELARLRREKRLNEDSLKSEVDLYKRRANDYQSETFKYKQKVQKYQSADHEKYTKQFQTLKRELNEIKNERDAKEHEKVTYCKKYKDTILKLKKMKDEYKKLFDSRNSDKQQRKQLEAKNSVLTEQIAQITSNVNNNNNHAAAGRKRKLEETTNSLDNNPKKKMKLNEIKTLNEILDDNENDEDEDEHMLDVSINPQHVFRGYRAQKIAFDGKDKQQIIAEEMKRITELLINEMSGDPLDDLGLFIQSLSINNNQRICINEEREKWQKLLNENWFLSQQTKSLVPLIRLLYQILSNNDFNHIAPMSSAIRILIIIFDGSNGKLYRDMLFDSIPRNYYEDERIKKKKRKMKKMSIKAKKKKRKKKRKKHMSFLEKLIVKNDLNHLFIVRNEEKEEEKKGEERKCDDVEMKESKCNKKKKMKANKTSTNLPNITQTLMEILRVIETQILNKNGVDGGDKSGSNKRVYITNREHLKTFKYESSLLEYECLLLMYKLLFYSKGKRRIKRMIVRNIKLISSVLFGKCSLLKSKIICLKILIYLLNCTNKKINACIANMLVTNEAQQETSLLYHILDSLFVCSQFDLLHIDNHNVDDRNDIISIHCDIVLYRQQCVKFISCLVTHRDEQNLFEEKINSFYFDFKYFQYLLLNDNRVKTKLHEVKKPFFYLLTQFLIYLDKIQNNICYNYGVSPHFAVNQELHCANLKEKFNEKITDLIHFVQENSKIAQINRQFFENAKVEKKKTDAVETNEENKNKKENKANIISSSIADDNISLIMSPEIAHLVDKYIENIVEFDSFVLLNTCLNHRQFAVLHKQRSILMGMLLKLMRLFVEFMDPKMIKQSLEWQEFEIMKLLKEYFDPDPTLEPQKNNNDNEEIINDARYLYLKLNGKNIDIFSGKYHGEDHHDADAI